MWTIFPHFSIFFFYSLFIIDNKTRRACTINILNWNIWTQLPFWIFTLSSLYFASTSQLASLLLSSSSCKLFYRFEMFTFSQEPRPLSFLPWNVIGQKFIWRKRKWSLGVREAISRENTKVPPLFASLWVVFNGINQLILAKIADYNVSAVSG